MLLWWILPNCERRNCVYNWKSVLPGTSGMGLHLFLWNVDKINSHAVHGLGIGSIYETLYAVLLEESEGGQGPNLWAFNNNLIAHLFSAFSYNEFWEGDKSF